jgi:hypothetical protein
MGVKNTADQLDPNIEKKQRKYKVLKLDVRNDLTYMVPPKDDKHFHYLDKENSRKLEMAKRRAHL